MDTATGKLVLTKEESGDVDHSESETGHRLLKKQLRRNSMHPVKQTARKDQKLKGQNGHTIYV